MKKMIALGALALGFVGPATPAVASPTWHLEYEGAPGECASRPCPVTAAVDDDGPTVTAVDYDPGTEGWVYHGDPTRQWRASWTYEHRGTYYPKARFTFADGHQEYAYGGYQQQVTVPGPSDPTWHLEYPGAPGHCSELPCHVTAVVDSDGGNTIASVDYDDDASGPFEAKYHGSGPQWTASWAYDKPGSYLVAMRGSWADGESFGSGFELRVDDPGDAPETIVYTGDGVAGHPFQLDFAKPNWQADWVDADDRNVGGEPEILKEWTDASGHHLRLRIPVAPAGHRLTLYVQAWKFDQRRADMLTVHLAVPANQRPYFWKRPVLPRRVRCRKGTCRLGTFLHGASATGTTYRNVLAVRYRYRGSYRTKKVRSHEAVLGGYTLHDYGRPLTVSCRLVRQMPGHRARYQVKQSVPGQYRYQRSRTVRLTGC